MLTNPALAQPRPGVVVLPAAQTNRDGKVRLRLLQNAKPAAERNLELPRDEAGQLSSALLRAIVSEGGRVK
jgi:hypothetical protein